MNLFEYMIVPFGLSLKHKSLDNCFIGITYSVFGLFLVTIALSLPFFTTVSDLIMKINFIVVISSMTSAYCLLKNKFEKILGMISSIEAFEEKRCKPKQKFRLSLIAFILCFMLTFVASVYQVMLNVRIYTHLFKYQLFMYHHICLTGLHVIYFVYLIQFIFFETSNRYYRVLKCSNEFIKRFLCFKPNYLIRYQINEVLEKFKINDLEFTQTVLTLRKLILLIMFSNNIMRIFQILYFIELNVENVYIFVIIFYNLILNSYFISTQIIIWRKSLIQLILIKNIDNWKDKNFPRKHLLFSANYIVINKIIFKNKKYFN